MVIKKGIVILFLIIFIIFSFLPKINAYENIYLDIHIINENPSISYGNPAIVAGIWHYINSTFETQAYQDITLLLYQGTTIPNISQRDETNFYEWRYNEINGIWSDQQQYEGYNYINESGCKKSDRTYSFYIGIKDTFPDINGYYENWTLEIYKDTSLAYSEILSIEKPIIGIAKSHDDKISFAIDPFTEIVKENNEEYFIIENKGNVPLNLFFDYSSYNDIVEFNNLGKKLSPNNSCNNYITLKSRSWKPGILKLSGLTTGSIPNELVLTSAPITFTTNITTIAPDLEIYVGHSNYLIKEIVGTNIVFQYQDEYSMSEGEIRDITVYVSGDGIVDLDITGDIENVKILKIITPDNKDTPLTILSKNTSEYAITIKVEALRENKIGIITYKLTTGGKTENYYSTISIGPPSSSDSVSEMNIPSTAIFVGLCLIIVIGYIVYNQIKHKRR